MGESEKDQHAWHDVDGRDGKAGCPVQPALSGKILDLSR